MQACHRLQHHYWLWSFSNNGITTALRSTAAAFCGGVVGASKRKRRVFGLLSLKVLRSSDVWKRSPWKRLFIVGLSNKRTHCLGHLLALRFWTQGGSLVYCGTLLSLPSRLCWHRGGAWAESMLAGINSRQACLYPVQRLPRFLFYTTIAALLAFMSNYYCICTTKTVGWIAVNAKEATLWNEVHSPMVHLHVLSWLVLPGSRDLCN